MRKQEPAVNLHVRNLLRNTMNARSVFTYAEASVCAIPLGNAVHRKTGKKYSAKPSSLFSSTSSPSY